MSLYGYWSYHFIAIRVFVWLFFQVELAHRCNGWWLHQQHLKCLRVLTIWRRLICCWFVCKLKNTEVSAPPLFLSLSHSYYRCNRLAGLELLSLHGVYPIVGPISFVFITWNLRAVYFSTERSKTLSKYVYNTSAVKRAAHCMYTLYKSVKLD